MLDVFVLPSGMSHADFSKTEKSIQGLTCDWIIRRPRTLKEFICCSRSYPFYMFIFDNESLDLGLQKSLNMFLKMNMFDVLVLWKKDVRNGFAEYRPRIFRSNLVLRETTFTPIAPFGLKTEGVLNGWILEHGFENTYQIEPKRFYKVATSLGQGIKSSQV